MFNSEILIISFFQKTNLSMFQIRNGTIKHYDFYFFQLGEQWTYRIKRRGKEGKG